MGRELRATGITALSVAASCTAEAVADVGALSVGDPTTVAAESSGASTTTVASTDTSSGPAATTSDAASDSGSSAGADASDGGLILDVGSDERVGCASTAEQYIYLLDSDGGLHTYDPDTAVLEALGTPQCEGAYVSAALTIDRDGLLWALMVDEPGYRLIYTIDPATLDCTQTDFADPDGYSSGGLAFVADAPDSQDESLYVGLVEAITFDAPFTLGKIELANMSVEIVGELPIVDNGSYQVADLTGTGDARMFGFFTGDAVIAEIEESDASLAVEQSLAFGVGSPWAFAQWSGRLWLFSPGDGPGTSQIRAYDVETQQVEEIDSDLAVAVVGAAVSTCAPYEPEG